METKDFLDRCERLSQRAQSGQWDGNHDLPWHFSVDCSTVTLHAPLVTRAMDSIWNTLPLEERASKVRLCLGTLMTNLAIGEAFVDQATDELSHRFPHESLRLFVKSQSADEARHEKVLLRYVKEKLGFHTLPTRHVVSNRLPEGTHLARERWQATTLLLLCLEIAALAAIQGMRTYCDEPLLEAVLRRVISDESRHISGLTLALRDPEIVYSQEERQRMQEVAVIGFVQGLAVTEKPVLMVAGMLEGSDEEVPDPEWFFFRKHIASTLLPKLTLAGIYDETLAQKLEAVGCPVRDLKSAATLDA